MKKNKKKIIKISVVVLVIGLIVTFTLTRPPHFKVEKLHLYIDESEFSVLSDLRDDALELGHLDRSPNDYVPGCITYLGDSIGGKIRLKGDWLDHLDDNKWSFRIKLDKPMDDGLQVFSVQNPKARGFLDGYVFNQLLIDEGVLSNEMRFIELIVNGATWGIYCIEEHLTTRMITNQGKPNGVLLKFNDNTFFNTENKDVPGLIKAAKIKVYGDAKKKKEYKADVKIAKQIIGDYQKQIDSNYNYFDPQKMGMYYAICDLTTAYHAMGWINIRFYYNFETKMMEPVGYDPYPVLEWGKPYLGKEAKTVVIDRFDTRMIVYSALHNNSINEAYYVALNKVTHPKYVNEFLKKHKADLDFYESEIKKEYNYDYDYDFLLNTAIDVQKSLNP